VTTGMPSNGRSFAEESSRIGINLVALVVSRCLCLGLTLVQSGVMWHALTVEGRGQFGFALGFSSLFTVFATLGIQRLLIRDIARDPGIAWTHVWTAEVVVIVLSVVVSCIIAGTIRLVESDAQVQAAVMLAASWVVVLWALQCPFEALLIARERMVLVALVNAVGGVLRLASVFFVVRAMPTSWAAHGAIAAANLIAFALYVVCAIAVGGWERPRIRLAHALSQVRESIPFTAAMVCSLVYFKSDMTILTFLEGETAAGIYTPIQRLTEPIMMIAALWGTTVFPALCRFSVNARDHYDRLQKTSLRLALCVALPMAFGLAAVAEPVLALLTPDRGEQLAQAAAVLRMMCIVVPFFYLNGIGQESFYAVFRNWFVVGCYALAAVVSVAGNLIAIPLLGIPGVAVTAIAANGAICALFVRGMRAEYGAMELAPLVAKTLAACCVMGLVAYGLSGVSLIAAILAGAGAYVLLQHLLGTLSADERALLVRLAWRRRD